MKKKAKRTVRRMVRRPRRAKRLKCGTGYRFKLIGRNKVALMRGNSKGGTFTCECGTTGGCKVHIDPNDPQTIMCLESGCTGSCGWVVSVPGLRGMMKFRL